MLEEKKKNPRKKKPNILLINTAVPKCALDHSARFGCNVAMQSHEASALSWFVCLHS